MAYMSQEKKASIAAALKKVVPEGWKYSLAVRHSSTIVMTISQAPVDLIGNYVEATKAKKDWQYGKSAQDNQRPSYVSVNPYYVKDQFSGEVQDVMVKIMAALNEGNWDKSDIQTDYFNVGWYVDLNIGKWNSPFLDVVPSAPKAKKSAKAPDAIGKDIYAKYLPSDWESLSPGKKAAATKRAKFFASNYQSVGV